ncbi:MAG: hemerythrin-like metal-binding protein [Rhodocyclaceae bacterium]|nr:MAG: hemerythrin-like metal-binding protein [Rhodocyclaceae bacterium]TND00657.1 MAG: hemerythrin-like metal-binding protein [Rhodocyclaceae bacterium]
MKDKKGLQVSKLTYFNIASTAETDREHQVQLALLGALCDSVSKKRSRDAVGEILEQLIAYSEAHFMSEELLMRLQSYDGYEDHVDDHVAMMDMLRTIAVDHAAGQSALVVGKAAEVLNFIGIHIATRDKRFADHLRNGMQN